MKKIEDLVSDIYGLFAQEEPFDVKLFRDFGDNLHDLMESRFHTKRSGKGYLRMSNIGRPDRQLWYDINSTGAKEPLPPPTLIKFAYGDMIEQMILLYAKMAGHAVEQEQAEVEVDGIKGHIDALIDGKVVDVKSTSSFSFQKFESGALLEPGNDPFGYVAQLAGYVEALTPGQEGYFLAVDKTLGKLTLLCVPAEILQKYKVHERIAHVKAVTTQSEIPDRCYPDVPDGKSGNLKLSTGCSYCPHRFHCWPDSNNGEGLKTYYYSTGPRYLTRVVRPPKVSGDFDDM